MKGSVYQRGSTWYYKFHGPDKDTSTGDYPWITKGGFDRVDRPIAAESTGHRPAQSPKTVGPDRSSVLGFSLCDNGAVPGRFPIIGYEYTLTAKGRFAGLYVGDIRSGGTPGQVTTNSVRQNCLVR